VLIRARHINTTGEIMPTKTLRIPTTDGQADAFAAFPDRGERHPGVLLYTDAFGCRNDRWAYGCRYRFVVLSKP
jgi:hypothetical protein